MNSKLNVDYKSLIEQKNVIEHRDFERIVREVYGLPYDVQRGELAQNSYVEVDDVDGSGCDEIGYWTGLALDNCGMHLSYENAKHMSIDPDDEAAVIEYWRNHSNTNASGYGDDRPFDDRYLDEKGEYSFWQPPEFWVLNNLCARGVIEPGNYHITIDW